MKLFVNFILLLVLFTSINLEAAVPKWEIIPEKSSIKFTGTQNNAPVSGEFKKFSGDLSFDPNQLNESEIKLVIDMDSVSSGFKELTDALKTKEWFDTSEFSKATFKSEEITQKNKNTFEVKGNLKIREKTAPIIVEVNLDENTPNNLGLHGTTSLKRTTFGVGQGEWADTSEVKDDVKVTFVLKLKRND